MKKLLPLLLLFSLFALSACKKSKAEKTIRGSWLIYEYDMQVTNQCTGESVQVYGYGDPLGTATFEKRTFSLAFNLGYLGEYCFDNTFLLNGDWNVDEHQREDLFFHVYPSTLGQETWQIEFYGDQRGYGQKAKGQDQMRFYRPNSLGNYDYIWLVRAN